MKERIAGRLGHFNNDQASNLLQQLKSTRLRYVLGAHVSARANRIELVRRLLAEVLEDSDTRWDVAEQDSVTPWYAV